MKETMEKNTESKKEKKAKKINVTIAPANWTRIKKYLQLYNDSENRAGPKLKYTNLINDAISRFAGHYKEK